MVLARTNVHQTTGPPKCVTVRIICFSFSWRQFFGASNNIAIGTDRPIRSPRPICGWCRRRQVQEEIPRGRTRGLSHFSETIHPSHHTSQETLRHKLIRAQEPYVSVSTQTHLISLSTTSNLERCEPSCALRVWFHIKSGA